MSMQLRIIIVCGDYKEADCTGEVVDASLHADAF